MADLVIWLERRIPGIAEEIYRAEDSGNSTTVQALVTGLQFAESKSVRTSTIILAAFNVVVAVATASSILYDCYLASIRNNKSKAFCVSSIHPAETFPLVLALGIVIQGIVFAVSQAQGLTGLATDGCSVISQFMFPAIFITYYITLVFGLECAMRSLRKTPFQPRGKYDVTICTGVIVLMLIATWVPEHIKPEPDHCFASLVWFVSKSGVNGLALLSVSGGLSILSAIVIFYRLNTTTLIDHNQRIAASRIVYYVIISTISLAFVLPWFVSLTLKSPNLVTSMMATVVLNLSGLMTGLLQLFLRSNTATTCIRPKGLPEWSRGEHEIRIWGPNELGFGGHLLQPVSGPRTPHSTDSRISLVGTEKERDPSMDSIRSPQYNYSKGATPMATYAAGQVSKMPTLKEAITPPASTMSPSSRNHTRKGSYSLFPTEITGPVQQMQLPASTFGASKRETTDSVYSLEPPPALHFIGASSRHRRDSSMVSSATVQIGLRLSHAGLEDENQPQRIVPALRPRSPGLQIQTSNLHPLARSYQNSQSNQQEGSPIRLVGRVEDLNTSSKPQGLFPLGPERDARMKTLPPTPRPTASMLPPASNAGSETESPNNNTENIQIQLSPTVYSPNSAKKIVETPVQKPLASNPNLRAAPMNLKPVSDPMSRASKADWI